MVFCVWLHFVALCCKLVANGVSTSFAIGHDMPLSREICKLCFRANPVGFVVPDEIWKDVIPPKHWSKVVCISCFAHLADEKLIPWDRQIRLYPVSMYTHLRNVKTETNKKKSIIVCKKKGEQK